MNIGPFYKDIWSLLFKHFEINFDPYTLNSLTFTCKKLNQIDKEHINNYKNYLKRKYKIKDDFFHLFFEKERCNYIKMDGHISIALTDFTTGKIIEKGSSRSFISVLPKIFDYLDKIEVNTYEEFKNMNLEELCLKLGCDKADVELIYDQTGYEPFGITKNICCLFCLKNDHDIVNSIIEIHSLW